MVFSYKKLTKFIFSHGLVARNRKIVQNHIKLHIWFSFSESQLHYNQFVGKILNN
jgi:hypothetical protein